MCHTDGSESQSAVFIALLRDARVSMAGVPLNVCGQKQLLNTEEAQMYANKKAHKLMCVRYSYFIKRVQLLCLFTVDRVCPPFVCEGARVML